MKNWQNSDIETVVIQLVSRIFDPTNVVYLILSNQVQRIFQT